MIPIPLKDPLEVDAKILISFYYRGTDDYKHKYFHHSTCDIDRLKGDSRYDVTDKYADYYTTVIRMCYLRLSKNSNHQRMLRLSMFERDGYSRALQSKVYGEKRKCWFMHNRNK